MRLQPKSPRKPPAAGEGPGATPVTAGSLPLGCRTGGVAATRGRSHPCLPLCVHQSGPDTCRNKRKGDTLSPHLEGGGPWQPCPRVPQGSGAHGGQRPLTHQGPPPRPQLAPPPSPLLRSSSCLEALPPSPRASQLLTMPPASPAPFSPFLHACAGTSHLQAEMPQARLLTPPPLSSSPHGRGRQHRWGPSA